MLHCAIVTNPISPVKAEEFVSRAENGAILSFVGQVRNHHQGNQVKAINYDCAPKLAQNILLQIAKEAKENSPHPLVIYVEHFMGYLPIGGISVIISIGSPHRDSAYFASRYIIEEIKTRLPIWKQEHLINGQIIWQDGHPLAIQPINAQK
jgi:molybdopterin synthase catalytic subunit